MTRDEKVRVLELITGLSELLGKPLSPTAAELYLRAIDELPFAEVADALSKVAKTRRFMPAPAEVWEEVCGSPATLEETGMIEAAKVIDAVKWHGAYRSVVFDNAVTMAVIQQGFSGWERLCGELTLEQEGWFRKDFVKTYAAFARAGIKSGGILYGITARQNGAAGHGGIEMSPALIGDPELCREVMSYQKSKQIDQPKVDHRVLRLVKGISN